MIPRELFVCRQLATRHQSGVAKEQQVAAAIGVFIFAGDHDLQPFAFRLITSHHHVVRSRSEQSGRHVDVMPRGLLLRVGPAFQSDTIEEDKKWRLLPPFRNVGREKMQGCTPGTRICKEKLLPENESLVDFLDMRPLFTPARSGAIVLQQCQIAQTDAPALGALHDIPRKPLFIRFQRRGFR